MSHKSYFLKDICVIKGKCWCISGVEFTWNVEFTLINLSAVFLHRRITRKAICSLSMFDQWLYL